MSRPVSARGMGWVTGIVVYVLVWWITLFAVLPLWVTPAEPDDPGHAAGAPREAADAVEGGGHDCSLGGDLARHRFCGELAVVQFSRAVS